MTPRERMPVGGWATSVPCPTCRAGKGQQCRTLTAGLPATYPHAARHRAWKKANAR